MDRLVCGDVGFGKTEVAMRAAFAVAMSGLQVAVVVPTTLLARQHYRTFSERFKGLPLKLGRASRLVAAWKWYHRGCAGMKLSGNPRMSTPSRPASSISPTVFSVVAPRSRKTGAA